MEINFWDGKRVFITGHTGFKGSWLCLWLSSLGAQVTGYALEPPTTPSLFELAHVAELLDSVIADIRDLDRLKVEMAKAAPEIVIHMAAQPLVRDSYGIPVETYAINVMGTVNLLEAVRTCPSVRAVVNVTTDKCYENREWVWGYRENEPMGGFDPYSSSKGCSELVTAAYRSSYFTSHTSLQPSSLPSIATARAGNVIGGGDWAGDRLVPDIIRAILAGDKVHIRNPHAIRPWQHVLEPLSGYLALARMLFEEGPSFAEGWNFGPSEGDAQPVEWIVRNLCEKWGHGAGCLIDKGEHPHEAHHLRLDCSKARTRLGWQPRWNIETALDRIVSWTKEYIDGENVRNVCQRQIQDFGRQGI
jgi:CDP-glucose 4,6-dehydratase